MKVFSILIVEDNPATRKLFRVTLELEGFRVTEAGDGRSALTEMQRDLPDLIVQDMKLPDTDGLELARRLRGLPGGGKIPIIAISGFQRALQSVQGEGVPFDDYLFKPVAPSRLVEVIRTHLHTPAESGPGKPKEAKAAPKRILAVDDDPLQLKLAKRRLESLGFDVVTAADAKKALAIAKTIPPDLILSDVVMPGMDGFDLCHAVRREPALADVPIILISAYYAEEADTRLAREAGARVLATRASDFEDVLKAVNAVFEGKLPPASVEPPAAPDPDSHLSRVANQLQRQVAANEELVERCAAQAAQLSIIGGVADALVRSSDGRKALGDVLSACLDAGGVSKGAIYRVTRDREVSLFRTVGFTERETLGVTDAFGWPELLVEVARGEPVLLSRHREVAHAAEFYIRSSTCASVLLPLFSENRCAGILLMCSSAKEVSEAEVLAFGRAIAGYLGQGLALEIAFAAQEAAYQELERTTRLKDEFLSIASHELRNPLNAIVGWSHVLAEGNLDRATTSEAAEVINRNALLQAKLIADIFDVQRITLGKLRLNLESVDLRSVIDAAIDTVKPAADAKAIVIVTSLDHDMGPFTGDPDRLQQIVWNLLSNAIKFDTDGGRVDVALERVDSTVRIIVMDCGPGIDPPVMRDIFNHFQQGDSSSTRRHGGLGLGLSIARSLAELHGGTIKAANRTDRSGAVFTVILPIRSMSEIPSSPVVDARSPSIGRAEGEMPELRGLKILLVDDQEDSRELGALLLRRCGADVVVAASAAEGLANLQRSRPHVLVSDIEMPGEDGYTFLSRVRALPASEGGLTPAAALTGYARAEDRNRALASGYQLHITKPVQPLELATAVANLAGRGHGASLRSTGT